MTMHETRCARCGHRIYLIKAGKTEHSYKWVLDPSLPRSTWKCEPTAEAPMRSHTPREGT